MKRDEWVELDELIRSKSYNELTDAERSALTELCNDEAEFIAVQQLYASTDAVKTAIVLPELNPELKTSLDAVFASKHPMREPIPLKRSIAATSTSWYTHWWVRIAAILLVISTATWMYLRTGLDVVPNNQLAENQVEQKPKIETSEVTYSENKATTAPPSTGEKPLNEPASTPRVMMAMASPQTTSLYDDATSEHESMAESASFSMKSMSRGMQADLFPQRMPSAPSLAQQNNEVLELLTPMY